MDFLRLVGCFGLFLVSVDTSRIETLDQIEDLKSKTFGHEYPRHGLLLLHWLANHISISQSNGILLHFDPARQDYGFRYYQSTNSTNATLPHLDESSNKAYYSVGRLDSQTVRTKLPTYVTQDYYNAFEDPKRDLDRIIIRVHRIEPSRADMVYGTQAVTDEHEVDYDPDLTFEISAKLLTQIKILNTPLNLIQTLEAHVNGTKNSNPRLTVTKEDLLYNLKHSNEFLETIFEDPGLRWLLILAGYDIKSRHKIHKKVWFCSTNEPIQHEPTSRDPETLCEGHNVVMIEVKSTESGYARIIWRGLPKNILKMNTTIVLFSSDTSSNLERFTDIVDQTSGSYDTYLALNHGIQPRLVAHRFVYEYGFIGLRYSVIWRGPQFDETNREIPTEITGYNASLQLYTTDGYACARIYIRKSFTDWKNEFTNSWVSFYSNDQDLDHKYNHYQWATNFMEADCTEKYLIYEYKSSMSIGPGVQVRFMFSSDTTYTRIIHRWASPTVKARTVPWESAKN